METGLALAALDRLLPMHLRLDAGGVIRHVGPTLAKTRAEGGFEGRGLFELFEFRRPGGIGDLAALRAVLGRPLRLRFRDDPHSALRAVAVEAGEGMVLNLSFGLSILDAIRRYRLHSADFATTDPTVEMLYLIEAKSAAMEESRQLNLRLQGAKIAAEEQAFTDTLTGLKNRRALDHVLARYRDRGTPFALMSIDLDFFKRVNDTLGHAAGDLVLQRVARSMILHTRPDDTLVRLGGDEFLIVLPDLLDEPTLLQLSHRLITELEKPIPFENTTCQISASIGLTATDQYEHWDIDRMMQDMDAALYLSKKAGRGRATLYHPDTDMRPTPIGGGGLPEDRRARRG